MSVANALAVLLAPVLSAFAGSVTNCGGAGDHFSGVKVSLSPDPIEKGKPFSYLLTGDLDEVLGGGTLSADLKISALGIIHENVKSTVPFTFSPAFAKGRQSLSIGPVSLPADIPGSVELSGKVSIVNAKGEPVSCIALDLNVPALADERPMMDNASSALASAVGSCRKATDHLHSLASSSSGGVTTITGAIDELFSKVSVEAHLMMHTGIIPIPLSLTMPVLYTPGIPKGDFKVTFGPAKEQMAWPHWPKPKVKITGNVVINDGNGEEITCIDIGSSEAAEKSSVLVV